MRILFFLFFVVFVFGKSYAQDCQVKVKISGIKKIEGDLIIALFDNEEDYLKKPIKAITLAVDNQVMTACINDIPEGVYSVSVIHDLDKNGKLNTRIYGPPSEPYGFHNNEKGFLGPPDFEDTSFELKKGEKKETEIHLFE